MGVDAGGLLGLVIQHMEIMERCQMEWSQKGTHEKHLSVYDYEKKMRKMEAEDIRFYEKVYYQWVKYAGEFFGICLGKGAVFFGEYWFWQQGAVGVAKKQIYVWSRKLLRILIAENVAL